ncbi:SNARE-interacting protein KEULE [Durusdinium trenchii]|uniref:SNARE-interacting protein KEULE n=1 Tax=Durusdinium trenchii TaxID=1381693 RepID=A0ABP0MFR5_9DINO
MSLRRTCRELVLQVVLRRAMKAGGDGLDRFQLVVDEATLRVINSFLKMGDLHGEGVTSVELIEESRQPLPGLDAMYFLRPFPENVERILGEFKSAAPQHRQVHLCFTKPVEQSLLSKFTEAPHLASRVRSFVEVPLSFSLVQDRGFHFDVPEAITALFPVPDPQLVSSIVQQLADVCRCLQTTTPSIRCQSDLCHTIGQRVLRELSMHQASALPSQPCQLLILERSVDMAAALVHEYSYEACVFDLLDGNMLDGDRNVVTLKTSHAGENKDKNKEMLLEDPLWEELRYMHIEAARSHVEAKVDDVKRQNNQKSSTAMSTSAMLEQLRGAPEMRDAVDRMSLHLAMIMQIHSRLSQEQILDPLHLGLLEQDTACGIDRNGKDVKIANLQQTLLKIFIDRPELPSEMKLRLLMLYFACVANIPEANRSKLMDAAKLEPEDHQVLIAMLRTRLMEVPESQRLKQGTGCAHRVTKQQAMRFKKNAVAEGRFELSRFEPRLKEILEQLAEDRLSLEDFGVCQSESTDFGLREAGYADLLGAPAIQAKDDWSFASVAGGVDAERTETSHRIVIFVLGGFTHSELRVAAEVQEKLPRGTEVLMGGTSLLTPKRLIRALRPKSDAAEGVDGPDLT